MISSPHCPLMRQVKCFPVENLCNEAGTRQKSASGRMDGNEESPDLGHFSARYRLCDKAPSGIVNFQPLKVNVIAGAMRIYRTKPRIVGQIR